MRPTGYFITVCARERAPVFGEIVDGTMRLNDAGRIMESVWDGIPRPFIGIIVDEFVVMPDHVHGIVFNVGAQFIAPGDPAGPEGAMNRVGPEGAMNCAPTLGEIVRAFKIVEIRHPVVGEGFKPSPARAQPGLQ